jgi:uncharacterized protein YecT (DUF1311 family)
LIAVIEPIAVRRASGLPCSASPVPRAPCRVPLLIATALALALSAPLPAADRHPIEAELDRCMESPEGMSTHGGRACVDAATAAWDRELNRVWKELRQELPPSAFAALRESQRKWIAFRDAELTALDASYGAMPGSMFQIMQADAISSLTRDRVRQLEALLEAQRVSSQ